MVGAPKQRVYTDFNQQGRRIRPNANKKTAIYGHVQEKLQLPQNIRLKKLFPNANMKEAHAGIGLMTQKHQEDLSLEAEPAILGGLFPYKQRKWSSANRS